MYFYTVRSSAVITVIIICIITTVALWYFRRKSSFTATIEEIKTPPIQSIINLERYFITGFH